MQTQTQTNGLNPRADVLVATRDGAFERLPELLRAHGIGAEAVRSSLDALGYLDDGAPRVAVLDGDLPMQDGWEISQRLRAGRGTPTLVLLEPGLYPTLSRDAARGPLEEYLAKPIGADELALRVMAMLGRGGASQPVPSVAPAPALAPPRHPRRGSRGPHASTALVALAMLVAGAGSWAGSGTQAAFIDTAGATTNTFSTGSVDLKLSKDGSSFLDDVNATFTANGLIPGARVTAPLTLRNAAATNARYSVESFVEAGGDTSLANRLDLVIGERTSSGTCDNTSTFGSTAGTANAWVKVYQGDLARGTSALALIGDKTLGNQPAAAGQISGDRAIAGNATDYLCFRVVFRDSQDAAAPADLAAGESGAGESNSTAQSFTRTDTVTGNDNAYKNLTTAVTFSFNAD